MRFRFGVLNISPVEYEGNRFHYWTCVFSFLQETTKQIGCFPGEQTFGSYARLAGDTPGQKYYRQPPKIMQSSIPVPSSVVQWLPFSLFVWWLPH